MQQPVAIAQTPKPPYYAVIFTSVLNPVVTGYADMATLMAELAQQQPGYLGAESARDGLGITVSYWSNLEAIKNWKANAQHLAAQKLGQSNWYAAYHVRICLVEKDYSF